MYLYLVSCTSCTSCTSSQDNYKENETSNHNKEKQSINLVFY